MSQRFDVPHTPKIAWLLGLAVLGAANGVLAAPPQHAAHPASLHARVHDLDAKIAAARTQNTTLQAQVSRMEQQNAVQQQQLQQRDAEIARLQQQLRAAGVPASATSAGR